MSGVAEQREPVPMGLVPGPFHARLAALNHQQAWTNWQGVAAPAVLDSVEFEYFAIRNQATLFDLSPMMKYRIAGPEAEAMVNRLVTREVTKLAPGRVAYVIWCDAEGNVVEDGTLFRFSASEFRLCCQEPQRAWLDDMAFGFDVVVEEVTEAVAALALQGPTSCAVLKDAGAVGIETLKPFEIRYFKLGAHAITISRTGFTGDLGYELWMAPEAALAVWDRLMEAGQLRGIRAIGYAALDMARIEAGFLLPRVDFVSSETHLRPGRGRNPYELGLGWLVAPEKLHFNGRRALLRLAEQKPARRLLALEIDRDKPAHHALVYHARRREAGFVTSALWSPTLKRNLALAWVEAPFCDRDDLWVEIYLQRELIWERRMARARVVERSFFRHPRRTATPPGDT